MRYKVRAKIQSRRRKEEIDVANNLKTNPKSFWRFVNKKARQGTQSAFPSTKTTENKRK